MTLLTHFDAHGQAHMVDVAAKPPTHRVAVASGHIEMLADTLALIESGSASKGDVLGIARIAGIQAPRPSKPSARPASKWKPSPPCRSPC